MERRATSMGERGRSSAPGSPGSRSLVVMRVTKWAQAPSPGSARPTSPDGWSAWSQVRIGHPGSVRSLSSSA